MSSFAYSKILQSLPIISLAIVLGACERTDTAAPQSPAQGPAERIGASVDQAASKAGEHLENFKAKHGPKIEEVKAATEEGARKLAGAVGEQMEQVGQKAQELSGEAQKQ